MLFVPHNTPFTRRYAPCVAFVSRLLVPRRLLPHKHLVLSFSRLASQWLRHSFGGLPLAHGCSASGSSGLGPGFARLGFAKCLPASSTGPAGPVIERMASPFALSHHSSMIRSSSSPRDVIVLYFSFASHHSCVSFRILILRILHSTHS